MVQSLWEVNKSSASQETPAFYGTWRFIIAFTRAHHLSIFSARPTQSIPLSHSLQILFFYHLCLVLQVISPSDFPTKILYAPHIHATCPANLVLLDFITQIIGGEYRSYSSSTLCSNTPVYILPSISETKFHTHTNQQAKLQFCIF